MLQRARSAAAARSKRPALVEAAALSMVLSAAAAVGLSQERSAAVAAARLRGPGLVEAAALSTAQSAAAVVGPWQERSVAAAVAPWTARCAVAAAERWTEQAAGPAAVARWKAHPGDDRRAGLRADHRGVRPAALARWQARPDAAAVVPLTVQPAVAVAQAGPATAAARGVRSHARRDVRPAVRAARLARAERRPDGVLRLRAVAALEAGSVREVAEPASVPEEPAAEAGPAAPQAAVRLADGFAVAAFCLCPARQPEALAAAARPAKSPSDHLLERPEPQTETRRSSSKRCLRAEAA